MISGQVASANQDFSRALSSRSIQEARRLLQSGAIQSATHDDFIYVVFRGDLEIIDALLAFPEIQAGVAAYNNDALEWARPPCCDQSLIRISRRKRYYCCE